MSGASACERESLCWKCTRPGTGTCSWDKNLTPVPGWDATAVRWRHKPGEYGHTWHVNACPLFKLVPDYTQRMTHASLCAQPRRRGRPPKVDWQNPKMGTFFRYGWSDRAVAQYFGICQKTATRYRKNWERVWEKEQVEETNNAQL